MASVFYVGAFTLTGMTAFLVADHGRQALTTW